MTKAAKAYMQNDRQRVRYRAATAAREEARKMQDELAHYRHHFTPYEISKMLSAIEALNFLGKALED